MGLRTASRGTLTLEISRNSSPCNTGTQNYYSVVRRREEKIEEDIMDYVKEDMTEKGHNSVTFDRGAYKDSKPYRQLLEGLLAYLAAGIVTRFAYPLKTCDGLRCQCGTRDASNG